MRDGYRKKKIIWDIQWTRLNKPSFIYLIIYSFIHSYLFNIPSLVISWWMYSSPVSFCSSPFFQYRNLLDDIAGYTTGRPRFIWKWDMPSGNLQHIKYIFMWYIFTHTYDTYINTITFTHICGEKSNRQLQRLWVTGHSCCSIWDPWAPLP